MRSALSFGFWQSAWSTVLINILSLALPLALLQVYDRIIPNDSVSTLGLLVVGVGIALLLEAALQVARAISASWSAAKFEHIVGCQAMERLLRSDIGAFERRGAGAYVEDMNALSALKDFYSGQALRAVLDLPFAALFIGLIAYLAGPLVLVTLGMLLAFLLVAAWLGWHLRRVLRDRMEADDRRFNFIIEVLSGIHTVKALAMEPQMQRRYERLQETSSQANYRVTASNAHAANAGGIFAYTTLFAVAGSGSLLVLDGSLSVGGLAACTMLSSRALQPVQRAMGVWTRFQSVTLARQRLRNVLHLLQDASTGSEKVDILGDEALELHGVGVSIDGEAPLFADIDLRLEPGRAIALCGGEDSGIGMLMDVIAGAQAPTQGMVTLGGRDLREFDSDRLARDVAYLSQHGVLFKGTILENLTMFRQENAATALQLARELGLDDIVARKPHGYNTMIGNSADDMLPRGIKQRISIIRALSSKPHVILFDEANTAIDSDGDQRVRQLLARLKGECALVLVSHRPSLLGLADTVYDLEGGRLRPREDRPGGTAATLLAAR